MNPDCFWLTDAQFARIKPHLPTDIRGKPRVDDRQVISGIVHVLKSDGRWIDEMAVLQPAGASGGDIGPRAFAGDQCLF